MEKTKDSFVSSHDGTIIKHGGFGIRNSYENWENSENQLYIKMKVLKNGKEFVTFFDHDDLEKVKKTTGSWSITGNGYVMNSSTKQYLHHLVMDFEGTGRGFQKVSVDHISRDRLDNRKSNLRLATAKEQQENSKGQIEGTKRERKKTAIELPDEITQDMLPKYVSYRQEQYKEYFAIEDHPVWKNDITVNGKHISKTIKSVQAQWVDKYAKPKVPYPILDKLQEIREKSKKLDEVWNIWKLNKTEKNITMPDDPVIQSLTMELRTAKNTKKVYKYSETYELVEEYDSLINAAKVNNVSDRFNKVELGQVKNFFKVITI